MKIIAGLVGLYGLCYLLTVMVLGFSLGDAPVTAASAAYVFGHALVLALVPLGGLLLILLCICLIAWAWE